MTQQTSFSRKEYMENKCTHKEYYDQFITPAGIELVSKSVAFKKLMKNNSEDLSSVTINFWDLIGTAHDAVALLNSKGDTWSLASAVCINKAIAEHIILNNKK